MLNSFSKSCFIVFLFASQSYGFVLPRPKICNCNNESGRLHPFRIGEASTYRTHAPYRRPSTLLNYLQNGQGATEKNFYDVLGVAKTASENDIKGAYRKLAKLYHPDANPDRDTTEQFKMLNRAYEVLRDPKLKQSYDSFGSRGIGTSAASDIDNMKRQNAAKARQQSSTAWGSSSSRSSTGASGGYVGNPDFWSTRSRGTTTSSSSGSGKSPVDGSHIGKDRSYYNGSDPGNRPFDPNPISVTGGKRSGTTSSYESTYTYKESDAKWAGKEYNDPGFSSRSRTNYNNVGGRRAASGPRHFQTTQGSGNKSSYYGDMGSRNTYAHTDNKRSRVGFEDKMFQDGISSGDAFFGKGPKFGRDVQVKIQIDSRTASIGGKKVIEVKHMETCGTCNGAGSEDPSKSSSRPCLHCGGTGYKTSSSMIRETCTACMGTGRTLTNACKTCKGHGMQQVTKSIEVTIPRHIDDGYTLRVPGEGDVGPNAGPSGDLYVCFKVEGGSTPKNPASDSPRQTVGAESRKRVSPGLRSDQNSVSGRSMSAQPQRKVSPGLRSDQQKVGSVAVKVPVRKSSPGLRSDQGAFNTRDPTRSVGTPSTANRGIVEKMRAPSTSQSARFGSTRTVSPDSNTVQPMTTSRRSRLRRGLRNFVSKIWSR